MGHDVVHLAGDAGALGRDGAVGHEVLFALQPLGPFLQVFDELAAGAHPQPGGEGERDEHDPHTHRHEHGSGGERVGHRRTDHHDQGPAGKLLPVGEPGGIGVERDRDRNRVAEQEDHDRRGRQQPVGACSAEQDRARGRGGEDEARQAQGHHLERPCRGSVEQSRQGGGQPYEPHVRGKGEHDDPRPEGDRVEPVGEPVAASPPPAPDPHRPLPEGDPQLLFLSMEHVPESMARSAAVLRQVSGVFHPVGESRFPGVRAAQVG
ncbi:hypothetical protein NOGI109294_24170 [Nocardiopsis gilva]